MISERVHDGVKVACRGKPKPVRAMRLCKRKRIYRITKTPQNKGTKSIERVILSIGRDGLSDLRERIKSLVPEILLRVLGVAQFRDSWRE